MSDTPDLDKQAAGGLNKYRGDERLAPISFAAPAGSAAWCVITELEGLKAWIKDGSGYVRDDAPDEIARAIDNRIREIKESMAEAPPNAPHQPPPTKEREPR